MSVLPSMTKTRIAARACTGGLTSSKLHSYAGSAPLGCRNHSRSSTPSWYLAKAGSRWAHGTAWNARSQAANHGYSHGSGIARTSNASTCRQSALRPRCRPCGRWGLRGVAVQPPADVVGVHLLAPDQPGAGLAQHPHPFVVDAGRGDRCVELVGLVAALGHGRVEGRARPGRSRRGRPPAGAAGAGSRSSPRPAPSGGTTRPPWCPRRSGLTVSAPETTWSLMPSFGYAVSGGPPYRRAVFVSLSQNTARGGTPSGPAAASSRYPSRRCSSTTTASPSSARTGTGWSAYHLHRLRNHSVGSTSMVASSGPRFSTVMLASTSVGETFA